MFGVAGIVFALQFFADVPKVRTDIMQKLPLVGDYFIREIPPSDNVPFLSIGIGTRGRSEGDAGRESKEHYLHVYI
ncbi:MAG: hypothetical protein Q9184_004591 [Pyrenodesmia sp. 2 TL-2023]